MAAEPNRAPWGAWRAALPLLLGAALVAIDHRISLPSCEISAPDRGRPHDPTVMIVSDLLLLGPDAGLADRLLRDPFTSKFLRKSLEKLKPDMLIVLGDISAKGSESTEGKWVAILQQFQQMLGPFVGLPFHVVLGDRDIGDCSNLDWKFVSRVASKLPGLDSSGCGAFEINNITFVSLNAVALLCEDNDLRFGVEKVVETESFDARNQVKDATEERRENDVKKATFDNFHWRENNMAQGSGPVLLLHFPLHWRNRSSCGKTGFLEDTLWRNTCDVSGSLDNSENIDEELHDLIHTLPPNTSEYILHALRPRVVFSAHTHNFCDHIHSDGTREVGVPAMTWASSSEPGFIVAAFGQDKGVIVKRCFLASERHVKMAYVFILILFIATTLVMGWPCLMNRR